MIKFKPEDQTKLIMTYNAHKLVENTSKWVQNTLKTFKFFSNILESESKHSVLSHYNLAQVKSDIN